MGIRGVFVSGLVMYLSNWKLAKNNIPAGVATNINALNRKTFKASNLFFLDLGTN